MPPKAHSDQLGMLWIIFDNENAKSCHENPSLPKIRMIDLHISTFLPMDLNSKKKYKIYTIIINNVLAENWPWVLGQKRQISPRVMVINLKKDWAI
jgi:hypothetical protein